jgi:hypothetical protein
MLQKHLDGTIRTFSVCAHQFANVLMYLLLVRKKLKIAFKLLYTNVSMETMKGLRRVINQRGGAPAVSSIHLCRQTLTNVINS